MSRGRLLAVAGPSGVGKSTVVRRLVERRPDLWLSVSATTRSPRPGEADGVDYFFRTKEQFAELIEADGLLEYATFAGNQYGTPRASVVERLEQGIDVILEIELQGIRQVKAALPEAVTVFIAPPSLEILVERLSGRGTETPEVMAARLEIAQTELAAADEFDYVVVNADIDEAVDGLLALLDEQRL